MKPGVVRGGRRGDLRGGGHLFLPRWKHLPTDWLKVNPGWDRSLRASCLNGERESAGNFFRSQACIGPCYRLPGAIRPDRRDFRQVNSGGRTGFGRRSRLARISQGRRLVPRRCRDALTMPPCRPTLSSQRPAWLARGLSVIERHRTAQRRADESATLRSSA